MERQVKTLQVPPPSSRLAAANLPSLEKARSLFTKEPATCSCSVSKQ
jgi:hypothetical protein